MSPDGALWKFKYDHNGLRTEREYSYSGEIVLKTEYTWVDEKLVKEYRSGGMNTTPITLEYFYNGEDLIGFSIQEGDAAAVNYYYGKTNNGEIRFIYDANGNIVTTYLYDAWGNPIPTDESSDSEVGEINPFRYKSYYYDSETRLYYLRSRSYDPVVGRFLNADAVEYLGATRTLLSFNLFAYCENNAVNNVDPFGTWILSLGFELQAAIVGGVYGGVSVNVDHNGDVLIAFSVGLTFVTNAVASASIYFAFYTSKKRTVKHLLGWGGSMGVCFTYGAHFGGGTSIDFTVDDFSMVGGFNGGVGASLFPVPYFQAKGGYTFSILQFNLYKWINSISKNTKRIRSFGLNITISKTRSYVDIYISNAKMHIILYKYGGIKLK